MDSGQLALLDEPGQVATKNEADFHIPRATVLFGDARVRLRGLPPASMDSCVTDPPYELGFMGKGWDESGVAFSVETWREVMRTLKPGGHLLAFGGTRTYHRMACAIEDAGFEVRDSLHWIYGTGFPKNKRLPRGKGTALKPAHEPIVMARKPAQGTITANVAQWGTGGLNIDACRIHSGPSQGGSTRNIALGSMNDDGREPKTQGIDRSMSAGRWPANVLFDEDAAAELDAQSGTLKSGSKKQDSAPNGLNQVYGKGMGGMSGSAASEGGASRFFYVAKAKRSERDRGCDALPARTGGEATDRKDGSAGLGPRAGAGRTGGARNFHPTVKPLQLMRYLCRLVTPPGGIVLDPFAGSGTTGVAALAEGYRFLGCELSAEYLPILRARIGGGAR